MHQEIQDLIKGYNTFRDHYLTSADGPFAKLVREGQHPKALVIACSDSRVDPALLLDTEPGDLFVVRNVANLIPPYEQDSSYHGTSAALEFGICHLKIPHIIVLGHSPCGGMELLLDPTEADGAPSSFLLKWLELAQPAQESVEDGHPASCHKSGLCSRASLVHSLENLMTFPWIQEKTSEGTLHLHAWHFDMRGRQLEAYCATKNIFEPLDCLSS